MDGYKIYKDGVLIGSGTGTYDPAEGEVIVRVADYKSDDDVINAKKADDIESRLHYYSHSSRNFTAKYDCAVEYIEWRKTNSSDDESYEDQLPYELFPELYDEYFNTYDLVPWKPLKLAQIIVKRHAQDKKDARKLRSKDEAKLRREKLVLESSITPEVAQFMSQYPTSPAEEDEPTDNEQTDDEGGLAISVEIKATGI